MRVEEYVLRFIIGGLAVSTFAVIGDVARPKSFAGLFGAAPSIALATLALAMWKDGPDYAAIEARSMIIGAVALCAYSAIVCYLMQRRDLGALAATSAGMIGWFAVALGGKWLLLG